MFEKFVIVFTSRDFMDREGQNVVLYRAKITRSDGNSRIVSSDTPSDVLNGVRELLKRSLASTQN